MSEVLSTSVLVNRVPARALCSIIYLVKALKKRAREDLLPKRAFTPMNISIKIIST